MLVAEPSGNTPARHLEESELHYDRKRDDHERAAEYRHCINGDRSGLALAWRSAPRRAPTGSLRRNGVVRMCGQGRHLRSGLRPRTAPAGALRSGCPALSGAQNASFDSVCMDSRSVVQLSRTVVSRILTARNRTYQPRLSTKSV